MTPTPKFCTQCGSPLAVNARFCAQCGSPVRQSPAPVTQTAVAPPPPAPAPPSAPAPIYQQVPTYHSVPSAPAETILSVIPGLQRKKGFLGMGIDTFTLVMTPSRLIFAYLDKSRMQQLVTQARDHAKAQGKGFFGQIGAQLGWVKLLEQQLYNTAPNQILADDSRSFSIPNQVISKVRVRQMIDDETGTQNSIQVVIQATSGKYKFQVPTAMGISHRELKRRLQQTLGKVVR